MSKPIIADMKPIAQDLQLGEEYYWCACGRSKNQPFCDGSHRSTEFVPVSFSPEESGTAYLCMCKHTKNPPYCDGTHATLGTIDKKKDDEPPKGLETPMLVQPTLEEPTVRVIHDLARDGLTKTGHHGEMGAMGVPRTTLPQWDDIQILAAQFATKPLMDEIEVASGLIIGPNAKKPLH